MKRAAIKSSVSDVNECVILLHGLARSNRSMKKLARTLSRAGYCVVNVDYPSTKSTVPVLAQDAIDRGLGQCPGLATIHFVTHSMGGILVRQYLSVRSVENLGRVVMLGPPNQGSQVVDVLGGFPGFSWFNGPAGMQLGAKESSIPRQLGVMDCEVGIIAGSRSVNLILSSILPRPNDGKVSVENTKLEGMVDHITLPVTHTFMMNNKNVAQQVIHFLGQGCFSRD